jgi:hypothetical protein
LLLLPALVLNALPLSQSTTDTALAVIAALIFYLVAPAFEASRWRATPGKRIVKLQITTKDAEQISYRRAFARNVLRTLTLYSYFFVIPLINQLNVSLQSGDAELPEVSAALVDAALEAEEVSDVESSERFARALARAAERTAPAAAPAPGSLGPLNPS